MSELEDKLNTILGDPQAMGQIMALAQSLGSGKDQQPEAPPPPDHRDEPPPSGHGQAASPPDLSALLGDHPRQSRKARQRPGEHCQSQAVKAKQQGQQASDYQLASKELWIRHRDGGQVLYGGVGVLLVNRHPPIIREMGRNS